MAMEYGTLPILDMIAALRADHWLHKHPDMPPGTHAAAIRRQMMDAFYVDTDEWRTQIVAQAREALFQTVDGLGEPSMPRTSSAAAPLHPSTKAAPCRPTPTCNSSSSSCNSNTRRCRPTTASCSQSRSRKPRPPCGWSSAPASCRPRRWSRKSRDAAACFYRIAERAAADLSFYDFLQSVHGLLGELLYAKNCYVCLYDAQKQRKDFPYYVDERDGDTLRAQQRSPPARPDRVCAEHRPAADHRRRAAQAAAKPAAR